MTTRTGKIARLPLQVREELNRRISDGTKVQAILEWINQLPEVQSMLQSEFGGVPVSHQNVSQWKSGGYRDWFQFQEARHFFTSLEKVDLSGLQPPSTEPPVAASLTEKLILWLTFQYAVAASDVASSPDVATRWARLREISAGINGLRRGNLYSEHIRLQREWLALDQSNSAQQKEKDFFAWAQIPENKQKILSPEKDGVITPEIFEQIERELGLL